VDHRDYLTNLLGLLTREDMEDVMKMHQVLEDIGQLLATDYVRGREPLLTFLIFWQISRYFEEMFRQVRQHHKKLYHLWCQFGKYGPDNATRDRLRIMEPVGNLMTLLSISITMQKIDYSKIAPINHRYYYPAERRENRKSCFSDAKGRTIY
jgi:hypothetical protein